MPDHADPIEVPKAPSYPFYIRSDDERRRFDLAMAIATEVMDAPPGSAAAWSAARVIYQSKIPT